MALWTFRQPIGAVDGTPIKPKTDLVLPTPGSPNESSNQLRPRLVSVGPTLRNSAVKRTRPGSLDPNNGPSEKPSEGQRRR